MLAIARKELACVKKKYGVCTEGDTMLDRTFFFLYVKKKKKNTGKNLGVKAWFNV